MGNLEWDSILSPRDLSAQGAGAKPEWVLFAHVYQILIDALRWELLAFNRRIHCSWLWSLSGSKQKPLCSGTKSSTPVFPTWL